MQLLVFHQGAIGDFLLAMPVIQSVREHLEATSVAVVASAPSARLAAGRSVVDRWLCPETFGAYQLFRPDLPVDDSLMTVLCEAHTVLSFLSAPNHLVHQRLSDLTSAAVVSVDPRPSAITRQDRLHISLQWANDIRRAGLPIGDPRPAPVRFDRPATSVIPRVLIHPGSGGRAKCWPMERYLELADGLPGTEVSWMLGPADAAQARMVQDRDEPILFEADLSRAADQMAAYDLYVGNDSGITHLAAAIGMQTVAIFGTTDPRMWRPLGEHVTVVAPDEPQDDMACISVDDVQPAVMGRAVWLLNHLPDDNLPDVPNARSI